MTSTTARGPLVISTMKNEAPYILEWVAYHRVIGFTDFLIYTNDCEDGTTELLDRLTELGIVQHERNKVLRRGPHKSALKYAQSHPLTLSAEWILISDVDEFLDIRVGDGSVGALIDSMSDDTDAISITWRLFSHDGQVAFVDRPVIAQFTDAERDLEDGGFPDRFVKTLFRASDRIERFGLHRPIVTADEVDDFVSRHPDGTIFDGDARDAKAKTHFAYTAAQMNHYAVRSVDSYLVKRDRGRANHTKQILGADYWQKMCRGGQRDTSIQRHLPAIEAEITALRADDEVARLHDAAVEWHRSKIEELEQHPEFAALKREILALSEGGDHLRTRDTAPMTIRTATVAADGPADPPQRTHPDPAKRLRRLAAEMRSLIDHVQPSEAAQAAHANLDVIERGLFGKTSR
ncbi:glycosyltransferase family 2 protein [Pontivivens ytuae]|uniref:Glycosyltransferase family 2 protein n=1 Tax=Pontivivens ytuae TaxID=2789856 RepID=A0A7S9LVH2_9RHOB|nr:glycosyltransferase family 2 protein [Pontivivens ytuae]QPH55931.1 glycosyltransferase family 2 protein [Pontivivens ytuae]